LFFVALGKRIKMEESSRYSENLTRKCQSLPPMLFWIRAVMMHFEGWELTVGLAGSVARGRISVSGVLSALLETD